jgi:hypothetical protein
MTFMSPSEDMTVQKIISAFDITGIPSITAWLGKTKAHGDQAVTIGFDFRAKHGPQWIKTFKS